MVVVGGVCASFALEVDVAVGRGGDSAGSSCHVGIHGGLDCWGVDGSSSTMIVGGKVDQWEEKLCWVGKPFFWVIDLPLLSFLRLITNADTR